MSDSKEPVKIQPEGNGGQAGQKPIDWREVFGGGSKKRDEGRGILNKLITNDADNPTKSRIPDIIGMVAQRVLGKWHNTTDRFVYVGNGVQKTVPNTVSGLEEYAYDQWNIISQSYLGKSREEYKEMGTALFIMEHLGMEGSVANKKITDEGSRKK